jgi:hypothetical protein
MTRATLLGAAVAALLAVAAAGAAAALQVRLEAPTHAPKTVVKWPYTVHASLGGKPARARLTAQIVDPLGGTHPVELGDTHTLVVRRRFTGVFRDFVRWPAESRGIPLIFRLTVVSGGARKVIDYRVTPRS